MKKCSAITALVTVAGVSFVPNLWAADVENGRKLARQCSVCHGKLGIGKDPEVPHLAGQPALYLEKSLVDYQTGKREDRRMTLMVKTLSKTDIKDLAAWFESIEIVVKDPAD